MAQPTAYVPPFNFSSELGTEHGGHLDTNNEQIKQTTDQIIQNLGIIQRDDGALANLSVTPDSLSVATRQLLVATGTPRGEWAASTLYAIKDVVSRGTTASYMASVSHVATTDFNSDLLVGKWILLQNTTPAASVVTFTPIGNISATTVQAAIAEVDTEKAKVAGDASTQFAVGLSTTDEYSARVGQVQKNSLRYAGVAAGTVDALTATIASSLASLTDGMEVFVKASGANATTTPTLNLTLGSTATGIKTITRATTGGALAAGSIAGNKHYLHLIWNSTNDVWVLMNTAA